MITISSDQTINESEIFARMTRNERLGSQGSWMWKKQTRPMYALPLACEMEDQEGTQRRK